MCTATWLRQPGGYHLFHNRDELYTRQPALPPRCHVKNGVRLLAPIDADAGGTWIGVNEFKLAACLLNRYDPITYNGPFTSRGKLVLHALTAQHPNEVCALLSKLPLDTFQPFTLALLYPDAAAQLLEWNGASLLHTADADARLPLVSSSNDQIAASQMRGAAFAALPTPRTVAHLRQYHNHHGEHGPTPVSVCMRRADAATVSLTHIEVGPNLIQLSYHPGPPCEPAEEVVVSLD